MEKIDKIVFGKGMKGLNLKERFIVKICRKTFKKVYRLGMIECFNFYNK